LTQNTNKIAVLFFENQKQNWARYPKLISKELSFGDKYFIYNFGHDVIGEDVFDGVFQFKGNSTQILSLINKYQEIIVISMSYRIIDLLFFNFILNSHGNVQGVSVQHGIYSDKLERVKLLRFITTTWSRISSYIYSLALYPFLSIKDKIILLYQIKKVYYDHKITLKNSKIKDLIKLPENVFILDRVWEQYYMTNYYTDYPKFIEVPSIDESLKNKAEYLPKNSVVILIQSMVEDGRYPREEYLEEINSILRVIDEDKAIYLKLHPRSDMTLYKGLCRKVELKKTFIVGAHVISSYSSLMKTYTEMGCLVFKWNFNNHHVPNVFNNYSHSSGREHELKPFLAVANEIKKTTNNINVSKEYCEKLSQIV